MWCFNIVFIIYSVLSMAMLNLGWKLDLHGWNIFDYNLTKLNPSDQNHEAVVQACSTKIMNTIQDALQDELNLRHGTVPLINWDEKEKN